MTCLTGYARYAAELGLCGFAARPVLGFSLSLAVGGRGDVVESLSEIEAIGRRIGWVKSGSGQTKVVRLRKRVWGHKTTWNECSLTSTTTSINDLLFLH